MRIIAIRPYAGGRWLIRYAFPAPCGCYDIRMTTQVRGEQPTIEQALQAALNHKNEINHTKAVTKR